MPQHDGFERGPESAYLLMVKLADAMRTMAPEDLEQFMNGLNQVAAYACGQVVAVPEPAIEPERISSLFVDSTEPVVPPQPEAALDEEFAMKLREDGCSPTGAKLIGDVAGFLEGDQRKSFVDQVLAAKKLGAVHSAQDYEGDKALLAGEGRAVANPPYRTSRPRLIQTENEALSRSMAAGSLEIAPIERVPNGLTDPESPKADEQDMRPESTPQELILAEAQRRWREKILGAYRKSLETEVNLNPGTVNGLVEQFAEKLNSLKLNHFEAKHVAENGFQEKESRADVTTTVYSAMLMITRKPLGKKHEGEEEFHPNNDLIQLSIKALKEEREMGRFQKAFIGIAFPDIPLSNFEELSAIERYMLFVDFVEEYMSLPIKTAAAQKQTNAERILAAMSGMTSAELASVFPGKSASDEGVKVRQIGASIAKNVRPKNVHELGERIIPEATVDWLNSAGLPETMVDQIKAMNNVERIYFAEELGRMYLGSDAATESEKKTGLVTKYLVEYLYGFSHLQIAEAHGTLGSTVWAALNNMGKRIAKDLPLEMVNQIDISRATPAEVT
jgi:hypothetical protein